MPQAKRRETNRFTDKGLQAITKPGYHHDGGGLYFIYRSPTARSWVFKYTINHKVREIGLKSYPTPTPLVKARQEAEKYRKDVKLGLDPLAERDKQDALDKIEAAKNEAEAVTFQYAADQYIDAQRPGWSKASYNQWRQSLANFVYPKIGALPVSAIDTPQVLSVLQPMWADMTNTAVKVRGRIENILDWAKVAGYRHGDNPARWRGHLAKMLPKPSKVQRVEHFAALPYADMPAFMTALRNEKSMSASALEFTILTCARVGEAVEATWQEIDLEARMWTVPAERMKASKDHRVPLCDRAMAILTQLTRPADGQGYIFPHGRAHKQGKAMNRLMPLRVLKRMGRNDLTVHGFRSTFRDWCAEKTNYPSEVAEMALAHGVGDAVEKAYRRGDLFGKRRALAEDWCQYCGG